MKRCREIRDQRVSDVFVIDQIGFQQLVEKLHLAVREQHRTLGRCKALFFCFARGHFLVAREEFHRPVEAPGFFLMADKTRLRFNQFFAPHTRYRQGLRLKIIVFQHEPADLVGHVGKKGAAIFFSQLAGIDDGVDENLDIDLVIRTINTRRIIDRVGIDAATIERVLDAAQLREAKIAAFGHDFAAQVIAVDPQRVGRTITNFCMRLGARLHIGTNAAVVKQIDGCLQNGAHEFDRRHGVAC